MTTPAQSARDDLAFMRSLVASGDSLTRPFGEAYLAAGLIYGLQMVFSAGQQMGWLPTSKAWFMVLGFGPTLVFLAVLFWILRRGRGQAQGAAARNVGMVFACVGMVNLVLMGVIAAVAIREHNPMTWLIYPCCVFVLQGLAWLIAYCVRRRPWLALVAMGWFATALIMALLVDKPGYFILTAGLGLGACMIVPGAVILRLARKAA